jgi:putative hydrolase of the HAD superfamily
MIRQHLLIDADDTLWENNIYFEQAIHNFIDFLNHSTLTPAQIRAVLEEIELSTGYGTASFTKSLVEAYRRLAEREVCNEDLLRVRGFGEQIRNHPLYFRDGVQETLEYLASRHTLMVLTKGDEEEQKLKVKRSGLEDYFELVLVVAEKDVETYCRVIEELSLEPALTWMIGNAPRSDINPALKAGINAVFIPHSNTWSLEQQDIRHEGNGQLLALESFAELRQHF